MTNTSKTTNIYTANSVNSHNRHNRKSRVSKRKAALLKKYVILTLAFILIACAAFIGGMKYSHVNASNRISATAKNTEKKCYTKVQIQDGDTLWGIAKKNMDSHYNSTEAYVQEIMQINGLTEEEIHEGDYLMVSYYEKL